MESSRLSIRLNPDIKDLSQQAAEFRNQTVTEFVLGAALEAAIKAVAEQAQTELSNRDRDLFLKLLDAPPAPNSALRKAAATAEF